MEKKQKTAEKKQSAEIFTQVEEKKNEGYFTLSNKLLICTIVGILILVFVTFKTDISLPFGEGKVVVTVNGIKIIEDALQKEISKLPSYYLAAGVDQAQVRAAVLDQLITKELLLNEVEESAIVVTEEEVIAAIENLTGQAQVTMEELEQRLAAENTTLDDLKEMIKEQLAVNKLIEKDVLSNVQVTEEEITSYFEVQKNSLIQVRASHILVCYEGALRCEETRTKEDAYALAQTVLEEIKAGGEFSALANKYSDDPSAEFNSGDLGWFTKGQMVPAFETAVFSMNIGEMAEEPVETDFGYHIVTVTDKKDAFEDFKEAIVQTVTLEKQKMAVEAYLTALKEAATIVYAEQ
ncbi:MAG: peptidylprolyl isomerase [Nanoarchaeota archaeon]